MPYFVEYREGVLDEVSKFNSDIQDRIKKAMEERLASAPKEFGKWLSFAWRGFRSLRVGDYRVIYKVQDDKVIIYKIGHRDDVYEK